MTTPTPRTDAKEQVTMGDHLLSQGIVMADFARQLERELAQRDALIQRILDYPYLPQNLATIIRKELENV